MSRSDVVRRFYAAFTARDLPALLDTLDPEVDFRPVLGVLYSQHAYHGRDGMTRWYEELATDWDSFEMLVEEAVDAGDRVVAFVRMVARRGEQTLEAEIGVECRFAGERISSFVGRDAWDAAEEVGIQRPGPGTLR
jgi:ketosteroid isomerase-like protein